MHHISGIKILFLTNIFSRSAGEWRNSDFDKEGIRQELKTLKLQGFHFPFEKSSATYQ